MSIGESGEVDIQLTQEGHVTREAALGIGGSTNADIGFTIMQYNADGSVGRVVGSCKRCRDREVSMTLVLDRGEYLIVPLCHNQCNILAPRKMIVVVHSPKNLTVEKQAASWEHMARAHIG